MARAVWQDEVVAEGEDVEIVEGNVYFPPDAIREERLRESDHRTTCPWKGEAHYYDVVVDGEVNENAAWTYPDASEAAARIEGYVAFWNGVEVER